MNRRRGGQQLNHKRGSAAAEGAPSQKDANRKLFYNTLTTEVALIE
jgi:hypothetical protein